MLGRKIGLPRETIGELETFLRHQATVITAGTGASNKALDPGDRAVLDEAATAAVEPASAAVLVLHLQDPTLYIASA